MMNHKNKKLMQLLAYVFKDEALLSAALSHRSAGNQNYERLEFLGDAILNFVIASEIFQRYPKASEGELSRLRASLVNQESLVVIARTLNLGDYLRLGIGELRSGGVHRESILADALEAIIGAIYLDADLPTCRQHILEWYAPRFASDTLEIVPKDFKTQLQEFLQARRLPLPEYQLASIIGEGHGQQFHIICQIPSTPYHSEGRATQRRKAEQEAAQKLLEFLKTVLAKHG